MASNIIAFCAIYLAVHLQVFAADFSCTGRVAGYYADLETNCEQYHVCVGGKRQYTYSCPNTTRFLQKMMICEHAHLVDCSSSESYFSANLLLGQRNVPFITTPNTQPGGSVEKSNESSSTQQEKLSELFKSTTQIFSISSSTVSPNENKPTLKAIDLISPTSTQEISTQSSTVSSGISMTALEKEKIKPLAGPPITLNELFKMLNRGSFEGKSIKSSNQDETIEKSRGIKLDWTLPDVRAMFYIPDNEEDSVAPNIKRYSVVIPESKMIFKSKEPKANKSLCPSHCDQSFFKFNSCSPCVMIK